MTIINSNSMDETKTIRFDVVLTKAEDETLKQMLKCSHRTRKNMSEALIKLAIRNFSKGSKFIDLDDLGVIIKEK